MLNRYARTELHGLMWNLTTARAKRNSRDDS